MKETCRFIWCSPAESFSDPACFTTTKICFFFHQSHVCSWIYGSKPLTEIFGDAITDECSEDVCDKQEAHTLRGPTLWRTHLKFRGKYRLERQLSFYFAKFCWWKYFPIMQSVLFFSFCPSHFYDFLSNFPFKILFLPSTGHHPQKYHIHPSSDWIFEWLFWSLTLYPLSLISRDQQTGSCNLQTDLNHNSELRKCFEVKKKQCTFHIHTPLCSHLLEPAGMPNDAGLPAASGVRVQFWKPYGFTKHLISWALVSSPNSWLLVTVTEDFFPFSLFLSFSCAIMSNSFCLWNCMGGRAVGRRNPKKWMKRRTLYLFLTSKSTCQKKTPNPPILLQCSLWHLPQMSNFVWFSALSPYCKHVKKFSPLCNPIFYWDSTYK